MSLYLTLQSARTEEDVKNAYIKALGLKDYSLNLIDIQTKDIRFEAKVGGKISTYAMFTQLLHYVQDNLTKGEALPPFLCVIDSEKAAIMRTRDALPLLEKKTINRGKSASVVTQDALDQVSAYIGTYVISFKIATHEDEFIQTVKQAIASGDIIRTQITPDNLKQVFDKWIDMIGKEIRDVSQDDFSLLFFADIMNDGTVSTHDNLPAQLLHKNNAPAFELGGRIYELGNREGYRRFWAIYDRPPKAEYRNYLLERRDSLIPLDERSFKGAYYTPLHVVDKAYDKLTATLGKNWQKEYIVWDMCCGVGNLEVKHSNPRNLYMSTLDTADIDVMKATKTCVGAVRFQYDYLNDDITDDGKIDYSLTKKMPDGLVRAVREGKKILVLINPPYAEAMNSENIADNSGAEGKKGVQKTKVAEHLDVSGYAKRELFVQFLVRIAKEIPNAVLAMFSTLKYVNAPNFEGFRDTRNARYLDGFIVHSKSFDGLKGDFPIGFLIWQTNNATDEKMLITEISTEVLDNNANPIGEKKFYNLSNSMLLGNWVDRVRANEDDALPLKNAITPTTSTKDVRGTKWADGAIGSMICKGSDLQNAGTGTAILSSGYCSAGAFFITPENLRQAAIVFTVRRIVKPTRINDRDQFLQPTGELTDEFKADCLVWMLFNGSNLTASADNLERNGRTRSIVNHFIPYTEAEVGADERFESDFLVEYMQGLPILPTPTPPSEGGTVNVHESFVKETKKEKDSAISSPLRGGAEGGGVFSREAQAVLDAGRVLWQAYFAYTDSHTIREELKLNRPDVGWYQIRNALKKRNESGDVAPVSFAEFEVAYKALTEKLRPMVWELGFLR